MFEGKPTAFYDALSSILGLADLVDADRVLKDARKPRDATAREVRAGVAEVVRAAGEMNRWVLLSLLLDPIGESGEAFLDALDREDVREEVLARIGADEEAKAP